MLTIGARVKLISDPFVPGWTGTVLDVGNYVTVQWDKGLTTDCDTEEDLEVIS